MAEKLHYGTIKPRKADRRIDLPAAILDGEIGKCRYIMLSDFGGSRETLDASLERGLELTKN